MNRQHGVLTRLPGEVTKRDQREVLENDRALKQASTYAQHGEAATNQGRFAAQEASTPSYRGVPKISGPSPWTDSVAASLNSAPDRVCDDPGFSPAYWQAAVVGEPFEQERAAEVLESRQAEAVVAAVDRLENKGRTAFPIAEVLSELDDDALAFELRKVNREQSKIFDGTSPTLEKLEQRRLKIEAEIARRK